ncbi:uncharacterized protein TOT_010000147 [Theileria orientalis strain Shintoku]|uniref:Uncharacterized protein n=1 Tax=Theileria orientalis strain Shintoku TaxID=869250 RepID=J7M4K2_THEOR|nr:uncharacterized protein TOT_010000147 [Theileria orientalis strain Shintoku]PVC54269.1 hypothetical protein MACL_00003215 [Theileria orientalis]BAM38680.1 uncharacterized protein TOT_010000147 [Theileria orientalis strain Shintoku]|eukprot:XP_009688981.1 uncharacterized protein TOT_010000147 [Theileria orientalis strain Shintoku]
MVKQSLKRVDAELRESDDSIQELTNDIIIEAPWNLWKDLKTADNFFRSNLSKSLYYTLQIRLFREYIKQEFSKKRSRKGAAVKRAYAYSKNDAKKFTDTLDVLDLNQLWNTLDAKSSFDSKSLNDRLESVLSKNINKILKNDSISTDNYMESNYNDEEIESDSDSDASRESSDYEIEQTIDGPEEPLNDEEKNKKDKNNSLNSIEDKFFKFDEMEAFANEELGSEEDIDYFDSLGEESDDSVAAAEMRYEDFFRDPEDSDTEPVENLKALTCSKNLSKLDEYDKQMELMLQQLEEEGDGREEDEDMYRDEIDLLDEPEEEEDEEMELDNKGHLRSRNGLDNERLTDTKKTKSKKNKMANRSSVEDDGDDEDEDDGEEDDEIAQIENELVAPKHWSLMGESTGKSRPRNSLLDIELELPQPSSIVYNSEENEGQGVNGNGVGEGQMEGAGGHELPLELLIIQRIKSGVFDNVERKTFVEDQLEALNRLNKNKKEEMRPEDIDYKKSEMGLGEVYAQKYKEQFMAIDKLDPHKKDLNEQFARLMYKLDSLSNLTFVPKRTSETEKATAVPMITVETPVNIVVSGSSPVAGEDKSGSNSGLGGGSSRGGRVNGIGESGGDQVTDPSGPLSASNVGKGQIVAAKVSRSAKKRKFKNKMKGLVKSGRLTSDQVDKIKQKMVSRNKLRREDSKSRKRTGLTQREAIKHDMKSNRRIDTAELLSSVGRQSAGH